MGQFFLPPHLPTKFKNLNSGSDRAKLQFDRSKLIFFFMMFAFEFLDPIDFMDVPDRPVRLHKKRTQLALCESMASL